MSSLIFSFSNFVIRKIKFFVWDFHTPSTVLNICCFNILVFSFFWALDRTRDALYFVTWKLKAIAPLVFTKRDTPSMRISKTSQICPFSLQHPLSVDLREKKNHKKWANLLSANSLRQWSLSKIQKHFKFSTDYQNTTKKRTKKVMSHLRVLHQDDAKIWKFSWNKFFLLSMCAIQGVPRSLINDLFFSKRQL